MSDVSKEIAIELVEDGQAGNGIVSVTRTYGISASGTTASDTTSPSDITVWSAGSPTVTTSKPYLWVKEITVYTEIPDTTKYYCVGKRGDNGVDAKDVEWAYIRTTNPTAPTILNDSTYTDSNSKTYTADGHLPRVDATNRTDIEKENSGSSSKYYECTDDPKGVNDTWKYEWEIKRTKGNVGADGSTRTWNYYIGAMTLHNNYAESAFIIDIDNDNDQFGTDSDSKVLVEQTRSTNVTVYDGATPQTLTSLSATLKYEDGTSVPTSVATKTTDATTGAVSVKVLQNNTANTHTEIQAHISATCDKGTKTIVFTLYKVTGGAPGLTPIIYQVAATNKVFSFARASSNELTPSSESSNVTQINVARTEGNTTTILDTAQTGLTFSWGFDDDETPQASSQSIGDTIEVSASQATSHGRVWVLLSTGDRETLSIVKDGAKGASITKSSEVNTYKVSDSGTTTPTGTWYSTKAAANNAYTWSANRYMWTKTVITWSDTSTTTLYSAERNPDDGDAGMSIVIASQSVTYSKQTSGNLDPTTLTYGNYPSSLSKGDWLYSKTTVNYETSEGASAGSTSTYSVSYIGTDGVGQAGRGITGVYEHYKASANSTGETTPTSTDWGTTPTPSDWGKDKPYLWNYERITYSSGTTVERTTASVVAMWTEDGAGIDSITNYYLATSASSGITTSTSGWTTSVQTMDETNCYLWNYERISYTQGKSSTTTTPHIIGHYGRDGEVITKVNETYRYATNNTGTRPDASSSSWQTTKPTLQKGYWLYTETTIHWSNNTETVLYTSERNPNDGAAGQSIIVDGSTVMKYYVGSSNTTHPAENSSDWKDLDQVTQTQGMWLWSKSTTYYRKADSTSGSHDAGSSVQYNVSYIAEDGDTPEAARGVESITEYYKATNSSSPMSKPTSDSGWDTDPNLSNLTNKWGETYKYLWNYEKVTYNKAPLVERTIPQILAIWTKDGNAGKGIDSITNYYLINNSSTAPSRPSTDGTGGWSTTPTPPNSSNPYLWNYEKIVWLNPSSTTYTDVQMIGHYGKDGVSSLVVDLDNDSDQFGTDSHGLTLSAQDKATGVKLYYGTTPQTITKLVATVYRASAPSTSVGSATATTSGTEVSSNVTISSTKVATIKSLFSGTSGTVTFGIVNSVTINDDFIIKVEAFRSSSESRAANFTLKQVKSGEAGVAPDLCNLRPTLAKVSFTKSELSGSTAKTLGCGYTLVTPSGTTNTATAASVSVNGTTYYIWWRYVGGTYAKFTTSSTIYSTGIIPSTTQTGVEFVLSSASSAGNIAVANTLDYENVPIIKDGTDGEGITSANVWYELNQSSTIAPSDFTLDDFPTMLNSGYYVWEATKVTYTNGSYEFTGKMCLGATSEFLTGTEVYATSTSNSTTPTSWSTTYTKTKGYYLWTATRVQYTNGIYAYLNPKCVGYWGEDGTNGETPAFLFRWETSVDAPTVTAPNYVAGTNLGGWSKSAPNKVEGKKLWMSQQVLLTAANGTYSWKNNAWSTPIVISGEDGDPGADSKEREWIYIRQTTYPFSGTAPASITKDTGGTTRSSEYIATHDDFVPQGWSDNALPATDSEKYVYTSWRDYDTSTEQWGAFQTPILWSNWGVQGMDGDGVQYIYKLFDHELTDSERTSNIPTKPSQQNSSGEWLPISGDSNWYDEPQAPTSSVKFCYCSIIKCINGTWGSYEKLGLWSKWSDDGTDSIRLDLDNQADIVAVDSDGKVRFARAVTVKARIYNGGSVQTSGVSLPSQASSYMSSLAISGVTPVLYHTSINNSNKITGTTTSVTGGILFIVWTFAKSTQMSANTAWEKTIQLKYSNVTYDAAFSVTSSDTEAIYQAMPTPSEVSFTKGSNNTLTPSSITLQCGYTKTTGSGTTSVAAATTNSSGQITESGSGIGLYLFYRKKTSGTWGSWTTYASKTASTGLTVDNDTAAQDYEFAICSSSSYSDANAIDREAVPVVKDGIDGTSPYVADLDNEMDSVACDKNGKPKASTTCETNISLFYGSTKNTFQITGITKNGSSSMGTGVTVKINDSTPSYPTAASNARKVSVTYATNATISSKDDFAISLRDAADTSVTRVLHFTINGVREGSNGEPAVIYNLKPSASEVSVGRTDAGAYNPSTFTLRCGYTKNVGGQPITTVDDATGRIDSTYNIYFSKRQRSNQSWTNYYLYQTYKNDSMNRQAVTLTNVEVATYDQVQFVLSTGTDNTYSDITTTTIIDKETVPIVSDGLKGDDGENGDTPVSVYAWNISSNDAPSISGNAYPPTGWSTSAPNRPDMAVVLRNNFTTSNWNTYGTEGHVENWSSTSSIRGSLTTGSWFVVFGKATDGEKLYHTLLYQCDNTSGDLHGVCMAHYSSSTDNNEYFLWESQSWRHKSSNGTLSYDTWGSPFRISGDTGQGGLSISITPNTMAVNTNASGVAESASQDFSISVYRGGEKVSVYEYTTTHTTMPSGWTWTGRNYDAFTISCASGTSFTTPSVVTVTVTLSNGDSISTAVLLVPNKRGKDGADAIYLDLDNEMDSILYSGGSKVGDSVTSQATLYNGGAPIDSSSVTFNKDGSSTATGTVNSAGLVTVTGLPNNSLRGVIVVKATYNQVDYFATFTVDKIVDKPKYEISVDKSAIVINTDTTSSSQSLVVRIWKSEVNSSGGITRTNITSLGNDLKLFYQVGSNQPGTISYSSGSGTVSSITSSVSKVTIWLTDSTGSSSSKVTGLLDIETVPVAAVQNGGQGKMGRSIYYWGDWDEKSSTDTFTVTDTMAPYVSYGNEVSQAGNRIPRCWIFVGENGSYTKSTAGDPSNTNQKWQLMTTDNEYLITKVLFTDFAKLGSGIFNGDYAFSQWGTNASGDQTDHYENFMPLTTNFATPVTSSNTYSNPVSLGTFYTYSGRTYTFKFELDVADGNIHFVPWGTPSSTSSGWADSYVARYERQWTATSTGTKTMYAFNNGNNTRYVKVQIIDTTFNPNLYIDWYNGEIYAQLGRFVNVTVEGVLNNLMQTITNENMSQYGICNGNTSTYAFWLNPTKVGSIIHYQASHPLNLPSVFYNTGMAIVDNDTPTHQVTLQDMRQCVGKKIYVHTDNNTSMTLIRSGLSAHGMLVYPNNNVQNLSNMSSYGSTSGYTKTYEFGSNTNMSDRFFVLECKMGQYNNYECIYWELNFNTAKLT